MRGFITIPGTREWQTTTLPQTITNLSGDWRPFHPRYEAQADRYETCACTIYAVQNAIEIMTKLLEGTEPNFSEYFNIIHAEVECPGISSKKADQSIKDHGLIPSELLPLPATQEAYLFRPELGGSILAKGQHWLYTHDFDREELFAGNVPLERQEAWIRYGLKRSPLAVGIDGHRKLITSLDANNRATFFDTYDHTSQEQNLKDVQIAECVRFYLAPRIHRPLTLTDLWVWVRAKM